MRKIDTQKIDNRLDKIEERKNIKSPRMVTIKEIMEMDFLYKLVPLSSMTENEIPQ